MFRQPKLRIKTFVLSARVRKPMADDILREAKKRRVRVSEEVRRRLEFYAAAHAKSAEPSTATAA